MCFWRRAMTKRNILDDTSKLDTDRKRGKEEEEEEDEEEHKDRTSIWCCYCCCSDNRREKIYKYVYNIDEPLLSRSFWPFCFVSPMVWRDVILHRRTSILRDISFVNARTATKKKKWEKKKKKKKDNDRQLIICSSSWGGMEKTFVSLHWFVVVAVVAAVVVDMLLFTFSGDGDTVVEGREAPARESSVWQHLLSPSNDPTSIRS